MKIGILYHNIKSKLNEKLSEIFTQETIITALMKFKDISRLTLKRKKM